MVLFLGRGQRLPKPLRPAPKARGGGGRAAAVRTRCVLQALLGASSKLLPELGLCQRPWISDGLVSGRRVLGRLSGGSGSSQMRCSLFANVACQRCKHDSRGLLEPLVKHGSEQF